ncbi:dephospho-CoA kinase [Paraphotobacterium marinum]|uniref:Dephospho-CoA kinase n=1 Tax=Paraphotobacterium marinum TaxID=1755811 RepID=A0A220VBZ1_9GAMM|nr:dephospho-CoA kinase [Paraphotobacterium marinum]ASK77914.1 dephospho-CoA kinase [Paraphotobacterium marinum]
MKYTIGLTGGIASGKTTVTNIFENFGINIIDADKIAKQVVSPKSDALEEIKKKFGNKIIKDNELNRALLRKIIFKDKSAKMWLESLLHPIILEQVVKDISLSSSPYCILSAPLLFEANFQKLTKRNITVLTTMTSQVNRVIKRDNVDLIQAKAVISNQLSNKMKIRLSDDIITNNSNLKNLKNKVLSLHIQYQQFSRI